MLKIAYELGLALALREAQLDPAAKTASWGTIGRYLAAPALGGAAGYAIGGKGGILPGMGLGLGAGLGTSLVRSVGARGAAQSMKNLKHIQRVAGGSPVWSAASGKATYRLP